MKFAVIVVFVTVLGAFAAHFLLDDPGYVVINFRGYLIEMSLLVLVGLVILLVVSIGLIRRLIQIPRRSGESVGRYREGRECKRMTRGVKEVEGGRVGGGEKV